MTGVGARASRGWLDWMEHGGAARASEALRVRLRAAAGPFRIPSPHKGEGPTPKPAPPPTVH
eukprot:4557374-Prymnesium_polylepis.1